MFHKHNVPKMQKILSVVQCLEKVLTVSQHGARIKVHESLLTHKAELIQSGNLNGLTIIKILLSIRITSLLTTEQSVGSQSCALLKKWADRLHVKYINVPNSLFMVIWRAESKPGLYFVQIPLSHGLLIMPPV